MVAVPGFVVKLNPCQLAGIFYGIISTWDDPHLKGSVNTWMLDNPAIQGMQIQRFTYIANHT